MKYLVTFIGHARTGTNYLCKLFEESFPDIDSHYELFNKQKCYPNEKYLEILEKYYNTTNLHSIANEKPLEFMDTIIDLSNKPVLTHKIFPEHLKIDDAYKMVDKSNFLFIVKRNFIDVYISKKRAIKMLETHNNPWINIDTTNFKINFDKEEFLRQRNIYNKWYSDIIEYIIETGQKYYTINYDCFHKMDLDSQQNIIRDKLSHFIPLQYLEITRDIEVLKKQDSSLDYKTKINNYDEFILFIS